MTTTMSQPRTVTGARYLQLREGDTFAVVIDASETEVSQRIPGVLWVAFEPRRVRMLFVEEHVGSTFLMHTTGKFPLRLVVVVENEVVWSQDIATKPFAGDSLTVDWTGMFEGMR